MSKTLHPRFTVAQSLAAAFSLILLLTIALGLLSRGTILGVKADAEVVTDDILPSVTLLTQIRSRIQENVTLMYRHGLAKEEAEMTSIEKEMDASSKEISALWESFEKMLITDDDKQLIVPAQAARGPYREVRSNFIKLSHANEKIAAKQALEKDVRPAYDRYITAVRGLIDYHEKFGIEASERTRVASAAAIRNIVIGLVTAVLLAGFIGWFIIRRINRLLGHTAGSLKDCSDGLAGASSQISNSSRVLAESSSEQAASLEETSASLEEIASMTRRNAENAQRAKDFANQTRTAADAGASNIAQMNGAMELIKEASNNISRIIKTIDEIAFQTNILALNAAVEAARAGEAGMGFAVVADEVRNLAQRSAHAARETAEKIEDCIAKSEAGVSLSAKVTESLSEIQDKARQVDELVAEIATASREQSQGIDQVNIAVTQMDKVTQSNAASAEESASAAQQLDSQAANLAETLEELLSLISGAKGAAQVQPAAPAIRATQRPVRSSSKFAPASSPTKRNGARAISLEDDMESSFKEMETSTTRRF